MSTMTANSSFLRVEPHSLAAANAEIMALQKRFAHKTTRTIMRKQAKPFIDMARDLAPKAAKDVFRYSTPKILAGRLRAPKGHGKKVATYAPGNLARSIRVLPLRRLRSGVIVGPKRSGRGSGTGVFVGRRVDGFYGHFMEFGTRSITTKRPYMAPAWRRTQNTVLFGIQREFKQLAEKTKAA